MINILEKFLNHKKARKEYIVKQENIVKNDDVKQEVQEKKELDPEKNMADFLNLEYNFQDLKKLDKKNVNAFEISDDNLIYLYPLNDGMPICGFEFYKNGELVIGNDKEFSEITNLDDIILQMVRVFNQGLDNKIVLNPYYFMLRLTDNVCKDYHGNADLVISKKAIRNTYLDEQDIDEANKFFINIFLDHFVGWNFGLSVNRSEILKKELEELNDKVIDMGIREYAGSGFEVYGVASEEVNGLQHYNLPSEKENVKKKILK